MSSQPMLPPDASFRETVELYLLDHRTPLGKAIDITLLGLNFVFIAVFLLETYPLSDSVQEFLWSLEVGIAFVFLVEYVLRLYGAQNRVAEFLDGYTMVGRGQRNRGRPPRRRRVRSRRPPRDARLSPRRERLGLQRTGARGSPRREGSQPLVPRQCGRERDPAHRTRNVRELRQAL